MGRDLGPWYKVLSHPSSPEFQWAAPRIPNFDPPAPCQTAGLVCSGLLWSLVSPGRACSHIKALLVSGKKVVPLLLPPVSFLTYATACSTIYLPTCLPDRPFPLAVADRRSISPDPSVADTSRGQGSQLVTQYHQPPRELIHINLGRPPAHTTASLHTPPFKPPAHLPT